MGNFTKTSYTIRYCVLGLCIMELGHVLQSHLVYTRQKHTILWISSSSILKVVFSGISQWFSKDCRTWIGLTVSSKRQVETWFQVGVWNLFALVGEGEIVRWSCLPSSSKNTHCPAHWWYTWAWQSGQQKTNFYTSLRQKRRTQWQHGRCERLHLCTKQ